MREGIYRHYKGSLYRVLCEAKHTETMEEAVVYQDAIHEEKFWARPAAMWKETVQWEGRTVPRFQYLGESLAELDGKRMFRMIEAIKENMEMYDRTSDTNRLGFYHKPTGTVVYVLQEILGALEEGEDLSEFSADDVKQAERLLGHGEEYIRLPDDDVNQYDQMRRFIYELPERYQNALENAIHGKGLFRRFKDTAARLGVLEDWYAYLDAAYRKEARGWCEFKGIEWWKELV